MSPETRMFENYWMVEGRRLSFSCDELTVDSSLPSGITSLQVRGHEFLHAGEGAVSMTFRRPDGSFVLGFHSLDNIALGSDMGRQGTVADGMFRLSCITGWTLPEFELYAGFNDPADHDLVIFFHDGVRALRFTQPGSAISISDRMVDSTSPFDQLETGEEVAVVHTSGMVLRMTMPSGLSAGMIMAPDGVPRLAAVIPCKGMAANTIACRYDVNCASDALTVLPEFHVSSPRMGHGDPGYEPRLHGPWALYEKDEPLDYRVSFGWMGGSPFCGKVIVEVRHALGTLDFRAEVVPELLENLNGMSLYRALLRPEFSLPGVSDVNVYLVDEANVVITTERLRVLYDWPDFSGRYNPPADLKAFWEGTLSELAAIPLESKVEETLFKDDPEWVLEHVSFTAWQGKRMHACLYIPKHTPGPLPVIVCAHPGIKGFGVNHRADGVYGSEVTADPRFVTIVPLIRGHHPDADDIPFNPPWWGPVDNRDRYVARRWYCAMVRALDYLDTRPELADMSRVIAKGGSQGGALALVTAALDRRVTLCLSECPSNCMCPNALQSFSYQTFGPTIAQIPAGQTLDDLRTTLSYYDPANMAPWVSCPTLIYLNVGDLTVHSAGGLSVFLNLVGIPADKKWFCPGVNGSKHTGSRAGDQKVEALMDDVIAERMRSMGGRKENGKKESVR